jgi:hypothetical protein
MFARLFELNYEIGKTLKLSVFFGYPTDLFLKNEKLSPLSTPAPHTRIHFGQLST